jgi:hypothetical protein
MNEKMTVEEWKNIGVIWNDDGSADIALSFPINVGGVKTKKVRMECPSLNQAEDIEKDDSGTAIAQEKRSVGALIGIAPEEVGQIMKPDYTRVQKVYATFLAGTPPTFIGGA